MAAVALSGCISVGATRVGDGVYVVDVQGNGFMSQGDALAEAYKAANKLCPNGFTVTNGISSSTSSFVRTTYGVQQISKPQTALVIRCQMQPAAPVPTGSVARWWCVTYPRERLGECYRNPSMCERRRATATQGGTEATACTPAGAAICFGIANEGQEGSDDMCQPNPETCSAMRTFVLAHPDGARVLTECRPID